MQFGNTGVYANPNNEGDEDEDELDLGPIPKKARVYESCGLATRQQEINELGFPGQRMGCFGCVYVGECDSGAIQHKDIVSLIAFIAASVAQTDPVNLAIHIATRYAKIRREINTNLMPNEMPLPEWKAATILDHIRNHNTDPEIQSWLRLTELQELIQIGLHSSVEYDEETNDKRLNDKQCKIVMDLIKLSESIAKSDPSKKMFYSKSKHIDIDATSRGGIISVSGKNIVDHFKNKRKR